MIAPVIAFATLGIVLTTTAAHGGLYWFAGVRGQVVSLCFVGDAVISRPDRVDEVRRYLGEIESRVNIRFDYLGTCPISVVQSDGTDYFDGDIRVVLPNTTGTKIATWPGQEGTGPVPGTGCPMFLDASGNYNSGNDGWGSWSNAPSDLEANRACLYNLKLGDDPWNATPYLNHTLHEFGHALGLAHEHERDDVDRALCSESGYGGAATDGHMTDYDRHSVMHYMFPTCGINGNYDYTGLSDLDRLALRILYPEDDKVAEVIGATVIRAGQRVVLQSGWRVSGANLEFVARNFEWSVDGGKTNSPDLVTILPVGEHDFQYQYNDFLGRNYSTNGTIKVVTSADYDRLIGATRAAQFPLF